MSLQVFILNGWATGREIWEPFIGALCAAQSLQPEGVHLLSWEAATNPADYKRLAIDFIENVISVKSEVAEKFDLGNDVLSKNDTNDDYLLIGWSLGAMVALDIWADLKCKPSVVVILSGSPAFCHVSSALGWPRSDVEAMKNRLANERGCTLKVFYQRCFTSKARGLGHNRLMMEASSVLPETSLISGLDYLMQSDLTSQLSEIDSPVLWLHGEVDGICPIGGAKRATDQLKQAQLVILPEAGHGIIMTSVEESVAVLCQFMCTRGDFHDR